MGVFKMITVTKKEKLSEVIQNNNSSVFIYLYTPLCGTCKLAESFLHIVEQMDGIPPIYAIDINYFDHLSENWVVTSVPCLVAYEQDKVNEKMYAFQSVTNIYDFIQRNTV